MTKTGYDTCTPENRPDGTDRAEARLARNRDILQQRLANMQRDPVSGLASAFGRLVQTALPLASRTVKQNPYRSLGGAMLAGVVLMRWKPWRGLGGSLLAGLIARQAFTLLTSRSGHVFKWLMTTTRSEPKTDQFRSGLPSAEK